MEIAEHVGGQNAHATFDVRFEAVRARLGAVCAAVVGRDDADDLVHETYLRARDRFSQLRDLDLFEAWIARIALNEARGLLRRNRRARERVAELRPRQAIGPDAGLRELVERLPPRERAVVVLHYGYGYRMTEIGRLLGLSEINVRTLAFRSRRRLRAQLEEAER